MKTIRSATHALMLAFIAMLFIGFPTFTSHAANCDGLQDSGNIPAGTYTLTDNCVITGILTITAGTTVTINGAGFAIDANNAFGNVLRVATGAILNLNNVTMRGGNDDGVQSDGTLTLTNSTVSGNGFGILNLGTLTLANSSVSDNDYDGITNLGTATLTNSTVSENDNDGIYNDGTVTLTNSTVSGNTFDGITNLGTATITNSTISDNDFNGIVNVGTATLTITNSTVSGNNRGIVITGISTLTNSIVSANRTNCVGTLTDGGGNLVNKASGGVCRGITPFVDADPLLGAFNGIYYPLLAGSPAIDAIDCATAPATDQIGTARPQQSSCDIGAIEAQLIVVIDPATGEETLQVIQPSIPSLNEWNATATESHAEAYGVQDNVYATVHMQNGAWQYNSGGVPQELIDYGVIFAIDVWEQGGDQVFDHYEKVCLLGEGRLVYFDATQSPRPMVEITPVEFEDGYTCGWIPNAGTIVLIELE